jgi:hypothetical protein
MANELQGAVTRRLILNRLISGVLTFVAWLKWPLMAGLTVTGTLRRLLTASRIKSSILSISGTAQRLSQNLFARTRAGVATLSGAYSYVVENTIGAFTYTAEAIISLSGTVSGIRSGSQRFLTAAANGALHLIGSIYHGYLWGTLSRILNLSRTMSGSLTMAGEVLSDRGQFYVRTLSGSITSSGSYLASAVKSGTRFGIVAVVGAISKAKDLLRIKSGDLTSTGSIRRTALVSHLYDGAVNLSGDVYRGLYLGYSGALTFAGTVAASAKVATYFASGVLSTAATVTRASILTRTKSGIMAISGLVSGIKTSGGNFYWVNVAGSITPSSILDGVRNLVTIIVRGTLIPIGRLTLIDATLDRISAAGLVASGSILRRLITARSKLTSALILSGLASKLKQFKRPTMAGVVSFAGTATSATSGLWNYTASGVLGLAGALRKLYEALRTYAGELLLSGIISHAKEMGRTISSSLTFAGQSIGVFTSRDWNLGFLTLTGDAVPYLVTYRPTYQSTLTVSGIVYGVRDLARTLAGSITPSAPNPDRYKDILYFGPPNP